VQSNKLEMVAFFSSEQNKIKYNGNYQKRVLK